MSDWTDERAEKAFALAKTGHSASEIARALGGVSRCGVIGKLRRSGVALCGKDGRPPSGNIPRQPKAPRIERSGPGCKSVSANAAHMRPAGPARPPRAAPSTPERATAPMVSLLELREPHCRWPIGDPSTETFGFCGAKRDEGCVYCRAHRKIAYQPQQTRKAKTGQSLARRFA